jgi:small subunit ribosomal protein S6
MFLLDTTKIGGDVPGAAEKLHKLLERNHAEILASRPWDERRLTYPIKNQKKGLYYLTYFRTEGKNLTTLKQDFALNGLILRSLILRIDPKLVDTMLAIARDENAVVALQNYQDDQAESGSRPASRGEPTVPEEGEGEE